MITTSNKQLTLLLPKYLNDFQLQLQVEVVPTLKGNWNYTQINRNRMFRNSSANLNIQNPSVASNHLKSKLIKEHSSYD